MTESADSGKLLLAFWLFQENIPTGAKQVPSCAARAYRYLREGTVTGQKQLRKLAIQWPVTVTLISTAEPYSSKGALR